MLATQTHRVSRCRKSGPCRLPKTFGLWAVACLRGSVERVLPVCHLGSSRARGARLCWQPGEERCALHLGSGTRPVAQGAVLLRSVQRSCKGFRYLRTSTLRLKFCIYCLGVLICPVYHFKLSDCVYQFMIINALGLSYYTSYATLY